MASAPHSTSLIEKYNGGDHEKGFYLFKNSGVGQNMFHITKEDSSGTLCGHYSLDRQHHNNKFDPVELDLGMSVEEVESEMGLGKGLCKNCIFYWRQNRNS